MRRMAVLIPTAALLAVPVALMAHDTKSNKVMGTVTAVHADMNHIEVKTSDGHTVGIKVDGGTKYTKAGRKPINEESLLPTSHVGRAAAQRLLDGLEGLSVSQHENQARAPDVTRPCCPRTDARFQLSPFEWAENDSFGHAA